MTFSDPQLEELLRLAPSEFEEMVTRLLILLGYRAQQTQISRDGGIDIWAEDERPFGVGRVIVQCKRYASDNAVGEPVVRELFGLVHAHGVSKGMLLTTSTFTTDARRFAVEKPIELIDGLKLLGILKSVEQQGHVAKPHSTPSLATFSSVSSAMAEILDWGARRPKPFALRITRTLTDFWDLFWSNWGPNRDCDLQTLLFVLDYTAAAYHLLEDANFRPEGSPPTIRVLFEQRLSEITSLIEERSPTSDQTARCEADEYLAAHVRNRDYALELCQSDLQQLCVQIWWKPHEEPYMLGKQRIESYSMRIK